MGFTLAKPHPVLNDPELEELLGEATDFECFIRFQRGLARALASCQVIPDSSAKVIETTLDAFAPEPDVVAAGIQVDGMGVPALVRTLKEQVPEDMRHHVHFGATSQDVIDTSLMLRMRAILTHWTTRIAELRSQLADLTKRYGAASLMARTRMQAALPITVGDRLDLWAAPLGDLLGRIARLEKSGLAVQFAGPVGTLDKFGEMGDAVRLALSHELDLPDPGRSWHTDRTRIADIGHCAALVSAHLGKIGQDVTLMSQQGLDEIALSGGGGSSAMAHKKNPVRAELLVTLARQNSALQGALLSATTHEQERSGIAWTQEWLTLPPMLLNTGAALNAALALIGQIERIGRDD